MNTSAATPVVDLQAQEPRPRNLKLAELGAERCRLSAPRPRRLLVLPRRTLKLPQPRSRRPMLRRNILQRRRLLRPPTLIVRPAQPQPRSRPLAAGNHAP